MRPIPARWLCLDVAVSPDGACIAIADDQGELKLVPASATAGR